MDIQVTPDKVTLTAEELQAIVKDFIRHKLGREVSGFVNFSQNSKEGEARAWCNLAIRSEEPKIKKLELDLHGQPIEY